MYKRLTISLLMFGFAGLILLISVFRTASVKYEFSGVVLGMNNDERHNMNVKYDLPFPGKVLPDSPFWPVKALRDRMWLATTTNDTREAELLLLLADKRIAASNTFFQNAKPELGYETLLKAEHYLKLASVKMRENADQGLDQREFVKHLALASLKHREIIELHILPLAPEDALPKILETLDTTKKTYEEALHLMNQYNLVIPENPFNG